MDNKVIKFLLEKQLVPPQLLDFIIDTASNRGSATTVFNQLGIYLLDCSYFASKIVLHLLSNSESMTNTIIQSFEKAITIIGTLCLQIDESVPLMSSAKSQDKIIEVVNKKIKFGPKKKANCWDAVENCLQLQGMVLSTEEKTKLLASDANEHIQLVHKLYFNFLEPKPKGKSQQQNKQDSSSYLSTYKHRKQLAEYVNNVPKSINNGSKGVRSSLEDYPTQEVKRDKQRVQQKNSEGMRAQTCFDFLVMSLGDAFELETFQAIELLTTDSQSLTIYITQGKAKSFEKPLLWYTIIFDRIQEFTALLDGETHSFEFSLATLALGLTSESVEVFHKSSRVLIAVWESMRKNKHLFERLWNWFVSYKGGLENIFKSLEKKQFDEHFYDAAIYEFEMFCVFSERKLNTLLETIKKKLLDNVKFCTFTKDYMKFLAVNNHTEWIVQQRTYDNIMKIVDEIVDRSIDVEYLCVCKMLLALIRELDVEHISSYWLDRFESILSAILCNVSSATDHIKSFYTDIIKIIEEVTNSDKKQKLFQIMVMLLNESFKEIYSVEPLKLFLVKHAIKKDYFLECLLPTFLECCNKPGFRSNPLDFELLKKVAYIKEVPSEEFQKSLIYLADVSCFDKDMGYLSIAPFVFLLSKYRRSTDMKDFVQYSVDKYVSALLQTEDPAVQKQIYDLFEKMVLLRKKEITQALQVQFARFLEPNDSQNKYLQQLITLINPKGVHDSNLLPPIEKSKPAMSDSAAPNSSVVDAKPTRLPRISKQVQKPATAHKDEKPRNASTVSSPRSEPTEKRQDQKQNKVQDDIQKIKNERKMRIAKEIEKEKKEIEKIQKYRQKNSEQYLAKREQRLQQMPSENEIICKDIFSEMIDKVTEPKKKPKKPVEDGQQTSQSERQVLIMCKSIVQSIINSALGGENQESKFSTAAAELHKKRIEEEKRKEEELRKEKQKQYFEDLKKVQQERKKVLEEYHSKKKEDLEKQKQELEQKKQEEIKRKQDEKKALEDQKAEQKKKIEEYKKKVMEEKEKSEQIKKQQQEQEREERLKQNVEFSKRKKEKEELLKKQIAAALRIQRWYRKHLAKKRKEEARKKRAAKKAPTQFTKPNSKNNSNNTSFTGQRVNETVMNGEAANAVQEPNKPARDDRKSATDNTDHE